MRSLLKRVLPDHPVPMRIWRGPFRGARVVMNPRASLRKVFGWYEHELNGWIEAALPRVNRVLDVGANDGYFTFGCAAALSRLGVNAEIVAFEAQAKHVAELQAGAAAQRRNGVRIDVRHAMVGATTGREYFALDDLPVSDRSRTLIKLDVEGAEVDVMTGARSWMVPGNCFVIEVHRREYLDQLREMFAASGIALDLIDQQPLPVLGRETRDPDNWWLVSRIDR